jgi:predicted nucleic acid-binding protein
LATQVVQERTSFTPEDAEIAARLFNKTARKRGTLMDCMIAATAIRIGAPLATSNVADFRRFKAEGLRIAEA